mmetsp:Transcript_48247/g.135051  ORF Transcript_48247/g.135051 Transcript_48247/m.135051 type:complete len:81 (+) Transcript_48247:810-1052(+)
MNSALLRTVAKSAVRVPKFNVQPIRKMGGDGHDHVHRVFPGDRGFNAFRAGMLCSVTVVGGVGIIVGACFHQNYKHGFLK